MLTVKEIEARLIHLKPYYLNVIDESSKHANHYYNPNNEVTHASIIIVSDHFVELSLIERHRQIYSKLKSDFANKLHALTIKALTISEYMDQN